MTKLRSDPFSQVTYFRIGSLSKWPFLPSDLFSTWLIFEVTFSHKWPIFEVAHFRSDPSSQVTYFRADSFSRWLFLTSDLFSKWHIFEVTHFQFVTFRRPWIIRRNFSIWNLKSDERSTMAVFCTMMVLTAALVSKLARLIKNGHVEPLGRARLQIPRSDLLIILRTSHHSSQLPYRDQQLSDMMITSEKK